MSVTVIREVTQNVWTFSYPFMAGSIPFGGRSTAIKLQSGAVWILASTELNNETRQKLDELGPVKYIMAGNNAHTMFLRQYKDAYPGAKLCGPEDLLTKKECKGLEVRGVYSATKPPVACGFEDEIETCHFSGIATHDIACFHKPSGTVMAADLLINNPPTEQFSKTAQSPKSFWLSAMTPTGWEMRLFLRVAQKDKQAMRRDAQKVYSWDFDRFIPCHGDVIETGGKAAWKAAWKNYLP